MTSPTTVKADQLRAGVFLTTTNQTILSITKRGLDIPSGKVEVVTKRSNGQVRTSYWSKGIELVVERVAS